MSYDEMIELIEGYQGCLKNVTVLNVKNPGYFTLAGYQHLDKADADDQKCHTTPIVRTR